MEKPTRRAQVCSYHEVDQTLGPPRRPITATKTTTTQARNAPVDPRRPRGDPSKPLGHGPNAFPQAPNTGRHKDHSLTAFPPSIAQRIQKNAAQILRKYQEVNMQRSTAEAVSRTLLCVCRACTALSEEYYIPRNPMRGVVIRSLILSAQGSPNPKP